MALSLTKETLSFVLSLVLTVFEVHLASPSPAFWGQNDHVSTSGILLVCKSWHAIATPFLYETVIIRSAGQAYALARTLETSPSLAGHIVNVRLEGAYRRLDAIFKRCINLKAVYLLMHQVALTDEIDALCDSFFWINPRKFVLAGYYLGDIPGDATQTEVFRELCFAIPSWTNLIKFHIPYTYHGLAPGIDQWILLNALELSLSLREVHIFIPCFLDQRWRALVSIDRIHLFFCPLFDLGDFEDIYWQASLADIMALDIPDIQDRIHYIKYDPNSVPSLDAAPATIWRNALPMAEFQDNPLILNIVDTYRRIHGLESLDSESRVMSELLPHPFYEETLYPIVWGHSSLMAHPEKIHYLQVGIFDFDYHRNNALDILSVCPSLKTLMLLGIVKSKDDFTIGFPELLRITAGSVTLEKIVIVGDSFYEGMVCRRWQWRWNLEELFQGLFERFPEGLFPNLKVIQVTGYYWPITHHAIETDKLIRTGQILETEFGLTLTDTSGKPFRKRVTEPPLYEAHRIVSNIESSYPTMQ